MNIEGHLYLNSSGRWEIRNDAGDKRELNSGDGCETFVLGKWIQVQIECAPTGYYAIPTTVKLHAGLRARVAP